MSAFERIFTVVVTVLSSHSCHSSCSRKTIDIMPT
jgi:hypothetical protein